MKLSTVARGALALAAVVLATSTADADEVKLDEVPAPARAAIERETSGARIKEIERETRGGKRVYEVEFIRDNREQEIHVAEDGTVLKRKTD
jgi:hypothetical protein